MQMNKKIPENMHDDFFAMYWQMLMTLDSRCEENDVLDRIMIDGAFSLLNKAGLSSAKPRSRCEHSQIIRDDGALAYCDECGKPICEKCGQCFGESEHGEND